MLVRSLREREKKNDCKWIQASFGSNGNVLTLIGVMAVQFCGSCESIQNLNCVNYVVCKVYLNKAVINFFFLRTKRKTARETSGTDFIALKKIPHTHTYTKTTSASFF